MNILLYPHPILEKKARPISNVEKYKGLLLDMINFVANPYNQAMGIALPQVGISKRAFVARLNGLPEIVINPVINRKSNEIAVLPGGESCLSIPNVTDQVVRYREINVMYLDINGTKIVRDLGGIDSIVFQHEYDHLEGILIIFKIP